MDLNFKHQMCISFLEEELRPFGFVRLKDCFYIEKENIIGFVKYRKNTIYPGFFIDTGVFFKKLESYRSVPIKKERWHLSGVLGNLNLEFRPPVKLSEMDMDILKEIINRICKTIKDNYIPLIETINDEDYLKENYPHNFDFKILQPFGMENYNRIVGFIESMK